MLKQDSAFLDATTPADIPPEDHYDNPVSMEYSLQDSANGDAAAMQKYGPPKPICNVGRMANVEELGLRNEAIKDPQIREPPAQEFEESTSGGVREPGGGGGGELGPGGKEKMGGGASTRISRLLESVAKSYMDVGDG